MSAARYHHQAYTLDERVEIPDEPAPAVGHTEEEAEAVKQASDEYRANAEREREEADQRAQEWSEREQKPTPTEFGQEFNREPVPDDQQQSSAQSSDQSSSSDQNDEQSDDDVPDGSVQDVLDWVGDDSDRAQRALDAERSGQNRSTLIAELEKRAA